MKFRLWRKMIACTVLLALIGVGVAWTTEQAVPQYREKEGKPAVQKHRKFPWLPVILGVGAGVVLVLLLAKKKKQTLTVNLHIGTSGNPAATATFKRGTKVSYNYASKAGFDWLQVRLDGTVVPPSGSVTMDRDHTFDVSATEYYTLTVNLGAGVSGTPTTTASYHRDLVVPYSYSALNPSQKLQVRIDNIVSPASGSVTMNGHRTLTASITNNTATFSNGVLTVNGIRYKMELIPPGEFQMGSDSPEANHDEQPVHTVLISKPFWLGKTEVTQELFQAVTGYNPSKFKNSGKYPVENARWDDYDAFIRSLNQMLGRNAFRWPTEAEWEYACRAKTTSDRYGELDAICWYAVNSGGHPHAAGLKQPNGFGLYDMLGNVWEWTRDGWGDYSSGYQVDPTGPRFFNGHVFRGGSWESNVSSVRSSSRDRDHPGDISEVPWVSVGFRLARTNE